MGTNYRPSKITLFPDKLSIYQDIICNHQIISKTFRSANKKSVPLLNNSHDPIRVCPANQTSIVASNKNNDCYSTMLKNIRGCKTLILM